MFHGMNWCISLGVIWLLLLGAGYGGLAVASTDKEVGGRPFVVGAFTLVSKAQGPHYVEGLVRKALAEQGYALELQFLPGRRSIAQLNNGLIDGDMARLQDLSKDFVGIVRVDEPLVYACVLFYRLQSHAALKASEPVRVGVISGAAAGDAAVLTRWPSAELVGYESIKQAAQLLMSERIDMLAVSASQRSQLLAEVKRSVALQDVLQFLPAYMHVHRSHEQLAVNLAESIKRLKLKYPAPGCQRGSFEGPSTYSNAQPERSPVN